MQIINNKKAAILYYTDDIIVQHYARQDYQGIPHFCIAAREKNIDFDFIVYSEENCQKLIESNQYYIFYTAPAKTVNFNFGDFVAIRKDIINTVEIKENEVTLFLDGPFSPWADDFEFLINEDISMKGFLGYTEEEVGSFSFNLTECRSNLK